MDYHINEFFSEYSDDAPGGNFHRVFNLNSCVDTDWDSISKKFPLLIKGWYELAHLPVKDRIEFSRDYWLSQLPYHQNLSPGIGNFFNEVDDIITMVTQKKWDDPYEVSMIYSLKDNKGFYKGRLPACEDDIILLQHYFTEFILPNDFLAFLRIHNGFSKATDTTGILSSSEMITCYYQLQEVFENKDPIISSGSEVVEPKALLPFYKSFGMPFYQCFWAQWHPQNEMGNVYYSTETNQIAPTDLSKSCPENLSFTSFSDWLLFYIESAY